MKKTLLLITILFSIISAAQDYSAKWEKLMKHEANGEIKSADKVAESIYKVAKKDKNDPQIIKTFFFRSKYLQTLEVDAKLKIVNNLRAEINIATDATKALLESLYAEVLHDIYYTHSYNYDKRKTTDTPPGSNFLLWNGDDFKREIKAAYLRSIENRALLYTTPLEKYNSVIQYNPLSDRTNHSLYDFLVERYLKSYSTFSDSNTLKNRLKKLFGNTQEFVTVTFPDSIKNSATDKIELQKDLEIFYKERGDTTALYGSILRRLKFMNETYYYEDKQPIYLNTLTEIIQSWGNHPLSYKAKLFAANLYKEMADKKKHPDYLIKSLALCNDILDNTKVITATPPAKLLKSSLLNQKAALTIEKYVLPNKPILAKVVYKNMDSLTVKIYRISNNDTLKKDAKLQEIKNHKLIEEKTYTLTNKNDYFEYETEIILPPLDNGRYLVTTTENNGEKFDFTTIYASQITLVEQDIDNTTSYQIADAESGKPITEATVMLDSKKLKSDKDGKFRLEAKKKNKDVNKHRDILITYKKDTLRSSWYERYSSYYEDKEDDSYFPSKAEIYFDRAIYRPGQTVFFKGIVIQYRKKKHSVVPNVYVTVIIEDPSGNELKNYRLKTNEFGSFTEEFTIPKNVLTGDFSVTVEEDEIYEEDENYNKRKDEHPFWDNTDFDYSYVSFSVEEYKRPTFSISYNPVKDNVSINKQATLSGKAKSFSGAPVSGAKVTYRVVRNAMMSRYMFYGNEGRKELINGETKTDNEGNFSISFTTIPDEEYDPKGLPVFTYTVYTNVTDINGETHSAEGTLKAGYHTLELKTSLPPIVNPKNENNIFVDSQNLNGEFTAVKGQVKIYKILPPENVMRSRPWTAPTEQLIPEARFRENFPHIPYTDTEQDTIIYSREVFSKIVDTGVEKNIPLKDFEGWDSGKYQLVFLATDSLGNDVEAKTEFQLQRNDDKGLSDKQRFSSEVMNTNFLKDGFVLFELRSSLPLLYVNVSANDGIKIFEETIILRDGIGTVKVPVKNTSAESIGVNIDFIWMNELFNENFDLTLTADGNKLQIQTETLTNKLQPGSNQNWNFTISGNTIPSEILASMYDASLDKFTEKDWLFSLPQSNSNSYIRSRDIETRGTSHIYFDNMRIGVSNYEWHFEHQINTFGFNINSSRKFYNNLSSNLPKGNISATIGKEGELTVTGVVVDLSGMLIPGININVEGRETGTQTDFDGIYTISVPKGSKLIFTYVGMEPASITVTEDADGTIIMEDGVELESIVVEGYRTTTRARSNVAVTTISSETIENRPNVSFVQSLQGQIPGLNISTGTGSPGSASTVVTLRGNSSINGNPQPLIIINGVPMSADSFRKINPNDIQSISILKDEAAASIYGNRGANGVVIINTKGAAKELEAMQQVQARKNFKETAFFYPQLKTDKKGNISFSFTTPEALTEWKLRLLAHNKKAETAYFENTFITQKDLMIVPNMPRFLREKDTVVITAKVTNMTTEAKNGNALLQLFDAVTMQPADAEMLNTKNMKPFTLKAKGNTTVSWKIAIPQGLQGVQYKVIAKSGDFTDGEENIIPVLTNTILVTESIPLWVRENTKREHTFENFKNNTSSTLRHHSITLEYTSNPAWLAIQSLPYLIDFEHDCAEQVFSRYYANAIASKILDSNPKIAEVFAEWRKEGKPASKFEQNEELKSIIMAESPWMLDAESEEEKKNRLALLFDLEKVSRAQEAILQKLEERQKSSGAFSWFDGGNDNEYITRHIIAGFGHLEKLGITSKDSVSIKTITRQGISYMDKKFWGNYIKARADKSKKTTVHINPSSDLHTLYARSFYFDKYPVNDSVKKAISESLSIFKKNWLTYPLYEKGLASLILYRSGDTITSKKILHSLKETSANNDDWGMYWIENKPGWDWNKAPIETQALLIEAFTEINNDTKAADAMKVWLLKSKQKNWPTTKSTTEAVYALLMQGNDWISVKENTVITLGNKDLLSNKLAKSAREAGSGYVKMEWIQEEVTKDMATVSIENKSAVPGYGGFYWQYFEELDKIKGSQQSVLTISKELYLKSNAVKGPVLKTITNASTLKIGDLITIRLIVSCKEDMEYIHLKDLRAAGLEPISVLSGYKWNEGLGYYQSTRDVATHFFFDKINKGTYILEYDVRVNNAGEFSNGITTVQSMYAPEFSAFTKGIRIKTIQ